MAFHGFMIIEIPLHDKPSVSINMHMPWRVITLPPDKDVTTASEFTHSTFMLPSKVTVVNLYPQGVLISLTNGKEVLTRNDCGVMLSFYELRLTLIFIPPVS
jgi:hypothetical protein